MSMWTHVIGSIRIDGLPVAREDIYNVDAVKNVLGPISTFAHPNNKCTLPTGSEGSLEYRVIEYDTGLLWIIIPIWGDLRDFGGKGDIDTIVKWWHKLLGTFIKKEFMIRDAIMSVKDENGYVVVLSYNEDENTYK